MDQRTDQPDNPKVMQAADMTVAAFDVLRHLLNGDTDKANEVLDDLDDRQGWTGLLGLARAIALATMDFSGLRAKMAAADPGQADAMVDEHFLWHDGHGVTVTPQGPDRDMATAGIRFMILCANESRVHEMAHDFHRQYQADGEELSHTISGLLTVTLMAIRMLPEALRTQLATFEPDTAFVVDTARQHGTLPT